MDSQGIRVVAACAGINLAVGVLHSWHVAKVALLDVAVRGGAAATLASLGDVYWVACLVYAFAMVLAGRLLDDLGPRTVAFLGGVLVGLGFLLVGLATTPAAWFAGFGVIGGLGLGFCHATTLPTALRWFSRTQAGLISGLVLAGSGLAALYVTPLTTWLLAGHGAQNAMLILGTGFIVVVSLLSQCLAVPHVRPTLFAAAADDPGISARLRSSTIWWLWTTLFVGAGAGLLVGDVLGGVASAMLGDTTFVVVVAIAGTAGRIAVGALSDRWGRTRLLTASLAAQAATTLAAAMVAGLAAPPAAVVLILVGLVAFNAGGTLALFPAFVRDRFGLRRFGLNYGVVFTAWGLGGVMMSKGAEALATATGSHRPACLLACVMLLGGAALSRRLRTRPPATAGQDLAAAPSVRSAG